MERSSWIMIGSVVIGAVLVVMGGIQMSKDASSSSGSNVIAAANGAKDEAAKSVLQNAIEAAKTYSLTGTYNGWTPAQGRSIEPSIRWAGSTPARANVVSIDLAAGDQLVMSTKSASGKPFCIADNAGVVAYGRMDGAGATAATSCTGGW
jgi:hypothetical protein